MTDELNKNRSLRPDHADFQRDETDRDKKRHREQDASRKEKLDDALERGLEDSFPGSDPVSVTQPPSNPHDKHSR
jgi:hypothetical protein